MAQPDLQNLSEIQHRIDINWPSLGAAILQQNQRGRHIPAHLDGVLTPNVGKSR